MPAIMDGNRSYSRAIAMLIGTIIGVGIFGVPYVMARSGVAIGLIHLIVLTAAILVVHLAYGELTLRTSDRHRLVGYAERYWGSLGRRVAAISTVAGMYGALLAYLIVSGSFLHQLFGPVVGGGPRWYGVAFGVLGLLAVGGGLRLVEELEFLLTAFLFIAMAVIFVVGFQRVDPVNWSTVDLTQALLPYGAILFSLGGASAITELRDVLRGRERILARAIAWGTCIAAALTGLFAIVVVGVSGVGTTPDAIAGLTPILGRSIVTLGAILGFLAIATSFLVLGLYLDEVFRLDFGLPRMAALLGSIGVPFAIYLLGSPDFTGVITITGALFGGIDGILIVLLVLSARRRGDRVPEFQLRLPTAVHYVVALLFVAGVGATIWELFFRNGAI